MGVCGITTQNVAYVLAIEITPSKQRAFTGPLNDMFYNTGVLLAAGLGFHIREWRPVALAGGLLALPLFIIVAVVVPESPRWLTWRNRRKEAAEVLARIAAFNRTIVTLSSLEDFFTNEKGDLGKDAGDEPAPVTYKDIFCNPVTRRCVLTLFVVWPSSTFIFTAVSYNLGNLFGDIYMNLSLMAVVGIVATGSSTFLAGYWGRVHTVMATFTCAVILSVVAVVCLYVPGLDMGVTVCAVLLRSCGIIGTVTVYTVILELFPTPIRNLVVGLVSGVTYAVVIVAPFAAGALAEYWAPIPYVIYGTASLASVFLFKWMPETKGIPMPETIDELENLKRSPAEPNEPAIDEKAVVNLGFEAGLEKPVIVEPLKLTPAQLLGGGLGQKNSPAWSDENKDIITPPAWSAENKEHKTNNNLVIITMNTGLASLSRARSEMLRQWNENSRTETPQGLVLDATTYETLLDDVLAGDLEENTIVTRL